MQNFWQKIKKPFFVMAPMANVTDYAFREIFAKYGKPDVTWTEFVSADGLISKGKKNLLIDLKYSKKQKPIVAQLFSSHPESMRKASATIAKLGFDGIDINMGCPDRTIEKQGAGAKLIGNSKLAISLIESARHGFAEYYYKNPTETPVSVKTRLGYREIDLEWIKTLLEQKLPALTIHLRTRKEMSKVPAHWEIMPEIIKMRNEISPETLIIGNGDVMSMEDAKNKIEQYGCDGIMIGRGLFGNPWFFDTSKSNNKNVGFCPQARTFSRGAKRSRENCCRREDKTLIKARLDTMLEHTKLFEKTFKKRKSFAIMKKHFKAYITGFTGAKELRVKLMNTKSVEVVEKIIKPWMK